MSEHMEPIPSRLYNAAVGGHVAGADQIIDDETGLTLDKVTGGALEEKTYTSGSDNGMGRVVLRKNLVNGVNTLVQTMINKSNTIYVIQYDFTLGENITVPINSILKFDGGSISAGSGENMSTIIGQNTSINAGLTKIFNTDVTLGGTWNVTEAYPEWFGAKTNDDTINNSQFINKAFSLCKKIKLTSGIYSINESIYLPVNGIINGNKDSVIRLQSNINAIVLPNGESKCVLSNFIIEGDAHNPFGVGVYLNDSHWNTLDNLYIIGLENCIYMYKSVSNTIKDGVLTASIYNLRLYDSCHNNKIYGTVFSYGTSLIKIELGCELYAFNADLELFSKHAVEIDGTNGQSVFVVYSAHIENSHPNPDSDNGTLGIGIGSLLTLYNSTIAQNGRKFSHIYVGTASRLNLYNNFFINFGTTESLNTCYSFSVCNTGLPSNAFTSHLGKNAVIYPAYNEVRQNYYEMKNINIDDTLAGKGDVLLCRKDFDGIHFSRMDYIDDYQNAIGPAIIDNGKIYVIAKEYSSKQMSNGFNDFGITKITTLSEAIADFDGKNKTSAIITKCSQMGWTSEAAQYCALYTPDQTITTDWEFAAGKWFMPAMGEFVLIWKNLLQINLILKAIGGNEIPVNGLFWTCSEVDDTCCWYSALNGLFTASGYYANKTTALNVLPICKI